MFVKFNRPATESLMRCFAGFAPVVSISLFAAAALMAPLPAAADDPVLADFYGFGGLEVVKIDRGAGPIAAADMNADGLIDLIAVNNRASRIEIHYQKKNASPDDEQRAPTRVNEFPEHWRFRREFVSVTHQVDAILPYDFNGDGMIDLIYGGTPAEIVFVKQSAPGAFSVSRKHSVKDLEANRNALSVANVVGDDAPELLSMVAGKISIWPVSGDNIRQPQAASARRGRADGRVQDRGLEGRRPPGCRRHPAGRSCPDPALARHVREQQGQPRRAGALRDARPARNGKRATSQRARGPHRH